MEREAEQSKGQKVQTAISFGATLLSSFMGRKSLSLTTLGRATTAARGVSRSMKEAEDVDRAQETVAAVNQQLVELNAQFKSETDALEESLDPQTESLETITLKPSKANITIDLFVLPGPLTGMTLRDKRTLPGNDAPMAARARLLN